MIEIRQHKDHELDAVLAVNEAAFGQTEEAELVAAILNDPTARPGLSLVATDDDGAIIGHILFSKAQLVNAPHPLSVSLLAPLAVHPDHQSKGIGGQLIKKGLARLKDESVSLVFVLGHPTYYPRYGFIPVGARGIEPPYGIPPEHADAWMGQCLDKSWPEPEPQSLVCCDALMQEKYWRE